MRVLVNAMPLRYGGGTTYLRQQLAALGRVAPGLAIRVLRSPWTELDGIAASVETINVRSVATRYLYEQTLLGTRSTDVLYAPANFGPSWARSPIVLTVQNANYYGRGLQLPETRESRPVWKVRANHWSMMRADAVVAISDSLAEQVLETLPRLAPKLTVIKSGAPRWLEDSRSVPGVPEPFFLSVASAAPHKHVDDIVTGWARFRDISGDDLALVLVGGHTERQIVDYRALAGRHSRHLVVVGRLQERANLRWLYERATAAISMSRLEAFPLTPAEAGSVGCPLVLSDIPPHREVTAGNAVFVGSGDVEGLAHALVSAARCLPGSRRWNWPVSWDDNARSLHALFTQIAPSSVSRKRS